MGLLSRMSRAATALSKYYYPFTWRNKPSIESPINEVHLNHIEDGINEMDNRILILAQDKADASDMANVFVDFEMSDTTGVMTFTRFDGSKVEHNTAVEKIALNCYLEGDNFVLELADGTKQEASLSKFIDAYTFSDTDTIRMTVNGKNISADIPDGKITLAKLEPTIMSTIRQYTLDAQTYMGQAGQSAATAQGWAIGGTGFEGNNAKEYASKAQRYAVGGVEEGDTKDNAKAYCEAAKVYAEQCQGVSEFNGTASTVSAIDTHGININTATDTTQVTVDDAWEAPIPGMEIAGKSEQGADPSPEYPQEIVSTDVTAVTVTGANLFDTSALVNNTASLTVSSDKRQITVTGSKDYARVYSNIPVQLIAGKTVTVSACISNENPDVKSGVSIVATLSDDKTIYFSTSNQGNRKYSIPENIVNALFTLHANNSGTVLDTPNTIIYSDVMLNIGDTALPWEPYQSKTASITLTEPLRGIGDVRDRIMCRDGVWGVERAINQIDDTGTVPISEALQVLDVPTWEPLPDETQAALNTLTTYKGRTTITVTAEGPEPDITMQYYGQPGAKTNAQNMLDSLARKVAQELVSNASLAQLLSGYIAKSCINNTGLVTKAGFVADARQLNPNVANSLAAKVMKNTDDIVTANSNLAKTNAKVTLNGVKNINGFTAVYSDRTDRAFQLYYDNGEIASIAFNNTGIWYDFYDGQKWKQVWKFNKPT